MLVHLYSALNRPVDAAMHKLRLAYKQKEVRRLFGTTDVIDASHIPVSFFLCLFATCGISASSSERHATSSCLSMVCLRSVWYSGGSSFAVSSLLLAIFPAARQPSLACRSPSRADQALGEAVRDRGALFFAANKLLRPLFVFFPLCVYSLPFFCLCLWFSEERL